MRRACIVVPAYRDQLDVMERISLFQLRKVLGSWDIIFALPERMKQRIPDYVKDDKAVFFEDTYFSSLASYSRLLLSKMFYERFTMYEYVLIHQLDAFVFSDRLEEFCAAGYDYIGAPCQYALWEKYGLTVGNGGFSLRRVTSVLHVLEQAQTELSGDLREDFLDWEDIFFSYCGAQDRYGFSVAPVEVAREFAQQGRIPRCGCTYAPGDPLPFGCHAWGRIDYAKWYPAIMSFGYSLPKPDSVDYLDTTDENFVYAFFASPRVKAACTWEHFQDKRFSVWGIGFLGQQLVSFLQEQRRPIARLLDRGASSFVGRSIERPGIPLQLEKDEIIIIGAIKDGGIRRALQESGLVERKNYFRLADFLREISKECASCNQD